MLRSIVVYCVIFKLVIISAQLNHFNPPPPPHLFSPIIPVEKSPYPKDWLEFSIDSKSQNFTITIAENIPTQQSGFYLPLKIAKFTGQFPVKLLPDFMHYNPNLGLIYFGIVADSPHEFYLCLLKSFNSKFPRKLLLNFQRPVFPFFFQIWIHIKQNKNSSNQGSTQNKNARTSTTQSPSPSDGKNNRQNPNLTGKPTSKKPQTTTQKNLTNSSGLKSTTKIPKSSNPRSNDVTTTEKSNFTPNNVKNEFLTTSNHQNQPTNWPKNDLKTSTMSSMTSMGTSKSKNSNFDGKTTISPQNNPTVRSTKSDTHDINLDGKTTSSGIREITTISSKAGGNFDGNTQGQGRTTKFVDKMTTRMSTTKSPQQFSTTTRKNIISSDTLNSNKQNHSTNNSNPNQNQNSNPNDEPDRREKAITNVGIWFLIGLFCFILLLALLYVIWAIKSCMKETKKSNRINSGQRLVPSEKVQERVVDPTNYAGSSADNFTYPEPEGQPESIDAQEISADEPELLTEQIQPPEIPADNSIDSENKIK